VPYYVIPEDLDGGGSKPQARAKIYDGVLPVFTSPGSFGWFVRAMYPTRVSSRLTPLEPDVLGLAYMAAELEESAGLKWLLFDPRISRNREWLYLKEPVSVGSFCRYLAEMCRGTKRLFAEGRAKLNFEHFSSEERDDALKVWVAIRGEKIKADARARTGEWEFEDDPWHGGRVPPA